MRRLGKQRGTQRGRNGLKTSHRLGVTNSRKLCSVQGNPRVVLSGWLDNREIGWLGGSAQDDNIFVVSILSVWPIYFTGTLSDQ